MCYNSSWLKQNTRSYTAGGWFNTIHRNFFLTGIFLGTIFSRVLQKASSILSLVDLSCNSDGGRDGSILIARHGGDPQFLFFSSEGDGEDQTYNVFLKSLFQIFESVFVESFRSCGPSWSMHKIMNNRRVTHFFLSSLQTQRKDGK